MEYGEIYDRTITLGKDYDYCEKLHGLSVHADKDEIKVTIDCRGGDHNFYFHSDTPHDNELEWACLEMLILQLIVKEDKQ